MRKNESMKKKPKSVHYIPIYYIQIKHENTLDYLKKKI